MCILQQTSTNYPQDSSKPQDIAILFVSQSFYPSIGGVSTSLINLIHNLLPLGYKVHSLHFDVSEGSDNFTVTHPFVNHHTIRKDNIPNAVLKGYAEFKEIIYQHLHGLYNLKSHSINETPGYEDFLYISNLFSKKIKDVINDHKIDILNIHDYQLIDCLRVEHDNLKKVFNLHAPLLDCLSEKFMEWLRIYVEQIDKFVLTIPKYKYTALNSMIPDSKISVIPPLIDPCLQEQLFIKDKNSKVNLSIPNDHIVISCVQRFDSKSGHEQLIKAFAQVVLEHPKVRLLLIGGPSFTDSISSVRKFYILKIQALVKELSLDNHVCFLGALDYSLVPQIFARSDIVCMLSKMECFGMAITEAMYHYCPVIVTDVGGLAFQVMNGVNGYKVPVGDISHTSNVIKSLIEDPNARASLGQGSKEFFNEYFAPSIVIKKYDKMYRNL